MRTRVAVLRDARGEGGWALVISLIVMVIMLGFGMAVLSVADTQSKVGASGRQRDEATQLADATLNATLFALSNAWPGQAAGQNGNPFPVCTPSQTDTRCPSAAMLQGLMNTPDTASNISWQINIYDNSSAAGMQNFYADSYTTGVPAYDANNDGKLWVRAQATVGTITKTVVSLAQAQGVNTPLPRATLIAGSLQLSNNGNKTIVDTLGNPPSPPPGAVDVRCTTVLNPNCLSYDPSKSQISPDTTQTGYTGGSSLNSTVQAGLKAEAIANGTYYATCPATPPSGAVVWIDSGNCSWTGNATLNSAASEGLMILNQATVSLGGTLTYYGLIYALNNNPTPSNSGTVVTVQGDAQVFGAIMVDGNGGVVGGSSKLNLTFDEHALSTVNTIGSVGAIQSTWREL